MRKIFGLFAAAALLVTSVATPAAASATGVQFLAAQYDSPGSDNRSVQSLGAEWVALTNTGPRLVDLTGWRVTDASGHTYRFSGIRVPGQGGKVYLHTGRGRDSVTDVWWGSGAYIWNNDADTATLTDAAGRIVDTCSWKYVKNRTKVAC